MIKRGNTARRIPTRGTADWKRREQQAHDYGDGGSRHAREGGGARGVDGGGGARHAGPAMALDKVTFGTNWLAEAEHGGFYQAVADGTYAKYGLDVTIVQGGPQASQPAAAARRQDRLLHGRQPASGLRAVAAEHAAGRSSPPIFQKDPQVMMAHPGSGLDKFGGPARRRARIFIGDEGSPSFYQWMKSDYRLHATSSASPTPSTRRRSSPTRIRSSRAT